MRQLVVVIGGGLLLLLLTPSEALAESKESPCPQIGIVPSRDATQVPLSVGGIPYQKKVISPAGALISEQPLPTLIGPSGGTTAPIAVREVETERPGWILLKPTDGPLVVGTYTAQLDVACTNGTTERKTASITVGPDAPLPTSIGTVRVGTSFVGAPANSSGGTAAKKSFDATTIFIAPSKELEPYLDVVAWRVTAISPEGKPHASVWLDYGAQAMRSGQTELQLSASAFCPAKGAQRIEVEAAIPGQPTMKTTGPTWDVGELVCSEQQPAGQPPAGGTALESGSDGEGCAMISSASWRASSSSARSGMAFLGALGLGLLLHRWRARASSP